VSPELPKQGSRPPQCACDGKEVGQDAQDHSRSFGSTRKRRAVLGLRLWAEHLERS
jgi:hypothetical protein